MLLLWILIPIWDKKDNKLIGNIQIREKDDSHPGQLSMWLNENYRGGGRITEAMFMISKAYFEAYPKEPSYNAHVKAWNYRSVGAMEKFGFVRVGEKDDKEFGKRFVYELSRETVKKLESKYL